MAAVVAVIIVVLVLLVILLRAVRIIPQAKAGIVERLGRYHKTLEPGLNRQIVKMRHVPLRPGCREIGREKARTRPNGVAP